MRKHILALILVCFLIPSSAAVVELNGTRLDMNNNLIQGFFNQSGCGANSAVETIYENGSYNCTTTSAGLEETLNQDNSAGDNSMVDVGGITMSTGDIDLDSNNIDNGGTVTSTTFDVDGGFLNMGSNNINNIDNADWDSGIIIEQGMKMAGTGNGICLDDDTTCSLPSSGIMKVTELQAPDSTLITSPGIEDGSVSLRLDDNGDTKLENNDDDIDIIADDEFRLTWDESGDDYSCDFTTPTSGNPKMDCGLTDLDLTGIGKINLDDNINTLGDIKWDDGDDGTLAVGSFEWRQKAADEMDFVSDDDGSDGGPFECTLSGFDGDFTCDGAKNFREQVNKTHNAVYTSQESGSVRALLEGTATTQNGEALIEYPYHFKQVLDDKPDLKVQVTPRTLTKSAVTLRNNTHIRIETGTDTKVDYTVKGIRKGYTDKQVVRKSE